MRISRTQLRYLAVMALDELAEREKPARKSLLLRFILAWLYFESGADPRTKWLYTQYWRHVTAPKPASDQRAFLRDYVRSTGAQSALNGICRTLGWERSASFMEEMKARRERRSGADRP